MSGRGTTGPDPPRRGGDRGMVTAETAIAIPGVLVLLVLLVWVIALVTAQMQVVDAARAGARAAARGESHAESASVAEQIAPDDARATVIRTGPDVMVRVDAVVEPMGGLPVLPSVEVHAVAFAAAEDTVGQRVGSPP